MSAGMSSSDSTFSTWPTFTLDHLMSEVLPAGHERVRFSKDPWMPHYLVTNAEAPCLACKVTLGHILQAIQLSLLLGC